MEHSFDKHVRAALHRMGAQDNFFCTQQATNPLLTIKLNNLGMITRIIYNMHEFLGSQMYLLITPCVSGLVSASSSVGFVENFILKNPVLDSFE